MTQESAAFSTAQSLGLSPGAEQRKWLQALLRQIIEPSTQLQISLINSY